MTEENKSIYPIITDWHHWLHERSGDCATLRRCQKPDHAVFHEPFHYLSKRLSGDFPQKFNRGKTLPHLACLLAHVKQDTGRWNADKSERTSHALGKTLAEAGFSHLRFRRLINNESRDELFTPLMRAISYLKGQVDVVDLAETVIWWGDDRRKQLATDYYQNQSSKN